LGRQRDHRPAGIWGSRRDGESRVFPFANRDARAPRVTGEVTLMQRLAVQILLLASRFVLGDETDPTRTTAGAARATVAARRRPPVRTLREPGTRASRAPATCRAFPSRSIGVP